MEKRYRENDDLIILCCRSPSHLNCWPYPIAISWFIIWLSSPSRIQPTSRARHQAGSTDYFMLLAYDRVTEAAVLVGPRPVKIYEYPYLACQVSYSQPLSPTHSLAFALTPCTLIWVSEGRSTSEPIVWIRRLRCRSTTRRPCGKTRYPWGHEPLTKISGGRAGNVPAVPGGKTRYPMSLNRLQLHRTSTSPTRSWLWPGRV